MSTSELALAFRLIVSYAELNSASNGDGFKGKLSSKEGGLRRKTWIHTLSNEYAWLIFAIQPVMIS